MEQTYPVLAPVQPWNEHTENIPTSAGVYAFFNQNNQILYVGKATNLKTRITSGYTNPQKDTSARGARITKMLDEATQLGYVELSNPDISLALEQHLIATLHPPYNIAGRTQNTPNRIYITEQIRIRTTHNTPAETTYGPWPNISTTEAANIITDYTQTANCTTQTYEQANKTSKPCYRGNLGTCWAPCVKTQNKQLAATNPTYQQKMKQAKKLLQGDKKTIQNLIEQTTTKMLESSTEQNYELAGRYRDKIQTLNHLSEAYRPFLDMPQSGCFIATAEVGTITTYYMITVENYSITTTESGLIYVNPETIYPSLTNKTTHTVYSKKPFTYINAKNQIVKTKTAKKVTNKQLLNLAEELAQTEAKHSWKKLSQDPAARAEASYEIGKTLDMLPPMTIESWDVSHLGGTKPVGAAAVLVDGIVNKEKCANYYLAEKHGGDDYTSLQNLTKVRTQKSDPPDLLIIDGGPGQLDAVKQTLQNTLWLNTPVIALAKRLEEIHLPDGEVIILGRKNPGLRLLQAARDAAHHQSVVSQRKRRKIKKKKQSTKTDS